MKKPIIFDDNKSIINTGNLSGDNFCSIAEVEIFLNKYGNIVVSACNHDGATGYWASSPESIASQMCNEALEYLLKVLQDEYEKRANR